jgi:hypothetical protein
MQAWQYVQIIVLGLHAFEYICLQGHLSLNSIFMCVYCTVYATKFTSRYVCVVYIYRIYVSMYLMTACLCMVCTVEHVIHHACSFPHVSHVVVCCSNVIFKPFPRDV